MRDAITGVGIFHKAADIYTPIVPIIPTVAVEELRHRLLMEEVDELIAAVARKDMVEIADGIADCIYILIGTALVYGIPLGDVWAEVVRTNIQKIDSTTGKVKKREDGKILKPEGWTPPKIKEILIRHGWDGKK